MSIVFGVYHTDGRLVDDRELIDLARATSRYAPDGTFISVQGQIGMGFQPCHTHQRSSIEGRPVVDGQGNMITLDGRIDNYVELCGLLGIEDLAISDSEIVLSAFARWGEHCFRLLIGDWALALWSTEARSLFLARDHAGTRTLFFENANRRIAWSTYIDTLHTSGATCTLDETYAACYLGCQSTRDLTPYKGVRSVTPAHYQIFREGGIRRAAHWQWMAEEKIQYKTDGEYQQHFLSLFRQSVDRRTGPGAPILAQLSGGIDSSSIVCMSDDIRRASGRRDLVDTLSYFDDSEPHWNERPYFTEIERNRNKVGIHVEASYAQRTLAPVGEAGGVYLSPGADSSTLLDEIRLERALAGRNYRAVLSGIGGDELLGGVPTPYPELCDYAAGCKLGLLLQRSIAWSVESRESVFNILLGVSKELLSLYCPLTTGASNFPAWLSQRSIAVCREQSQKGMTAVRDWQRFPSSMSLGFAWWSLLETLPHLHPAYLARREFRYPYLDRDLVDFLLRVPRHQVLRPGRRRFMMREALKGIVPREILERRRKAYLARGPLALLRRERDSIRQLLSHSISAELGLVDPHRLVQAAECVMTGINSQGWSAVLKAILFEIWLRSSGIPSVLNSALDSKPKVPLPNSSASEIRAGSIRS